MDTLDELTAPKLATSLALDVLGRTGCYLAAERGVRQKVGLYLLRKAGERLISLPLPPEEQAQQDRCVLGCAVISGASHYDEAQFDMMVDELPDDEAAAWRRYRANPNELAKDDAAALLIAGQRLVALRDFRETPDASHSARPARARQLMPRAGNGRESSGRRPLACHGSSTTATVTRGSPDDRLPREPDDPEPSEPLAGRVSHGGHGA